MEVIKIYLSGAMSSINFEEQTKWRRQFKNAIKFGDYSCEKNVMFFDPTQFYNFEEKHQKSEREVMEFDLYNLRNSDLVVVNFNDPNSLGTCAELAIAYDMKIPIVGINKNEQKLHPWLECFCNRMCNDLREAVSYVVEFYLN